MSTFYCHECSMLLIDTNRGYITGCEHYPADVPETKLSRRELQLAKAAKMEWERRGQPIPKDLP